MKNVFSPRTTGSLVCEHGKECARSIAGSHGCKAVIGDSPRTYSKAFFSAFAIFFFISIFWSATLSDAQAAKFIMGERVKTTADLNIRSSPSLSGTVLGVQPNGSQGVVIGGPTIAAPFTWWQINFDTGVDGWGVENYLTKVGVTPPPLVALSAATAVNTDGPPFFTPQAFINKPLSYWNLPIDPVATQQLRSGVWGTPWFTTHEAAAGVYWVHDGDANVTETTVFVDKLDGTQWTCDIPGSRSTIRIPNGAHADPSPGDHDHHVMIIDVDLNRIHTLYWWSQSGGDQGNGIWRVGFVGCDLFRGNEATILAAEAARWSCTPDQNGYCGQQGIGNGIDIGGVNNAGFNLAGLLMAADFTRSDGDLGHALACGINGDVNNGYSWPAMGWNAHTSGIRLTNGSLLRINPAWTIPATVPDWEARILRTYQRYGCYLFDMGSVTTPPSTPLPMRGQGDWTGPGGTNPWTSVNFGSAMISNGAVLMYNFPWDQVEVHMPNSPVWDSVNYGEPNPTPTFNFSLTNGGARTVIQGQSITNPITATLSSGTSQPVSFSAVSSPALTGGTMTFVPTSCNPTCSSTMTIATTASTPVGTYTITVTGTAGSLSRTTSFSLAVNPSSAKFIIGDRVQTTATLNVRSAPSGTAPILGTQPPNALGTVIGGPTSADGYIWWQINYDNAPDGWSVEDYLIKATEGPSLSVSPTTVAPGGSVTASWSGVQNPTVTDWIGSYIPGAPSDGANLKDWKYTSNCTQTAGSTAKASGSCAFSMPSIAGSYELRLFPSDLYAPKLATSPTITVTDAAFNFSLTNGGAKSVVQGSSVTNPITATLSSGTSQPVTFSAVSSPALTGGTMTFSPTSCNPTCSSTMTIATTASTPVGTYTITVTGTAGTVVRTTSFMLTVAPAATDLVAHYKLDETSGVTASDSAGTNSGTLVNNPTWMPTGGKIAGALNFDGTDDYVEVANEANFDFMINSTKPFTISLWGYMINDGAGGRMLTKMNTFAEGGLQINSNPSFPYNLFVGVGSDSSNTMMLNTAANSFPNNRWAHVVVTYNGNGYETNNFSLYMDGSVNENSKVKNGTPVTTNNAESLRIGKRGSGNNFQGRVDDIRIYNRALSATEVQQIYDSAPSFNFSLTNGGARTVIRGQSITNPITATLSSGTSQPVLFSASGLPTGATASFNPTSCNPTCSSTMTIATTASTPVGTYTVTVSATGGGVTKTTSFTLTVNALPLLTMTVGPNLSWTSVNTSSCTASGGWSGSKPLSGSEPIPLVTTSTSFVLTCAGPGGSVARTVMISIQ